MTLSVGVFAVAGMVVASREVGGVHLARMTASPVLAGAAMAGVMLPIAPLGVAIVAGVLVYLGAFVACERIVAPDDLRFVKDVLRRRSAPAPVA
jgi:hypothetical protein